MVKVSIFYPNEEGISFDMEYYCNNHIPLLKQLVGPACLKADVDEGMAGGTPGSRAPFIAMGHLYFNSMEDFVSTFTPHVPVLTNDIPNYTNASPVIQISEIKL